MSRLPAEDAASGSGSASLIASVWASPRGSTSINQAESLVGEVSVSTAMLDLAVAAADASAAATAADDASAVDAAADDAASIRHCFLCTASAMLCVTSSCWPGERTGSATAAADDASAADAAADDAASI